MYPDKAARREIDSLEVYCPNRATGCDWTGNLASVETHTSQCPHKGVVCPNEGCGQTIAAAKLKLHLQECPFRLVECDYCHTMLPNCKLSVSFMSVNYAEPGDDKPWLPTLVFTHVCMN